MAISSRRLKFWKFFVRAIFARTCVLVETFFYASVGLEACGEGTMPASPKPPVSSSASRVHRDGGVLLSCAICVPVAPCHG